MKESTHEVQLKSFAPLTLGITVPDIGIKPNSTVFTISTNARAGPVLPTTISKYDPIGSFVQTRLELERASSDKRLAARSAATLVFTFNASMDILATEVITFGLPDFLLDDVSSIMIETSSNASLTPSWQSGTRRCDPTNSNSSNGTLCPPANATGTNSTNWTSTNAHGRSQRMAPTCI